MSTLREYYNNNIVYVSEIVSDRYTDEASAKYLKELRASFINKYPSLFKMACDSDVTIEVLIDETDGLTVFLKAADSVYCFYANIDINGESLDHANENDLIRDVCNTFYGS